MPCNIQHCGLYSIALHNLCGFKLLSSQIAIRNQQLALKKRQSATYKWQFTVNYLRTSGERTLIAEFVHFIRTGGETRRLLGDVRSGSQGITRDRKGSQRITRDRKVSQRIVENLRKSQGIVEDRNGSQWITKNRKGLLRFVKIHKNPQVAKGKDPQVARGENPQVF